MMKATGRFCEPVESLEFSRYLVNDLPPDSFVFGMSNSGTVSRTIEGVRLARERGAWTFAVTVSADNNLARTAETLLKVNAPPNIKEQPDGTRVVTPGSVTYTASMLGLFIASIALGERIGHLDQTKSRARCSPICAPCPKPWRRPTRTVSALAPEIAGSFTKDRKTVILGGGPNYATAYFGMAKWFESLTRPCHYSELEEWAHEQYFFTDENTDTIIMLPPGAGRDRGLEQAQAARDMGSRRRHHRPGRRRRGQGRVRHLLRHAGSAGSADALRLQAAVRIPVLPHRRPAGDRVPRLRQQEAPGGELPPDLPFGAGQDRAERGALMSALLRLLKAGSKPVVGMVQLGAPAGRQPVSRRAMIDDVLAGAMAEADILAENGIDALMVQNLGDIPVDTRVQTVQATWMTRIVSEIRQRFGKPVGLNMLENDAEAMFAVASAAGADFVRIKIYVGAMVTPFGVETAQAFAAIKARTAWQADEVAILADVHDRTGVPLVPDNFEGDLDAAVRLGAADALVLTGKSYPQTHGSSRPRAAWSAPCRSWSAAASRPRTWARSMPSRTARSSVRR